MSKDILTTQIRELLENVGNNKWGVKRFVVNDEEQWWVESGGRNIALCMSKSDADLIASLYNNRPRIKSFLKDKMFDLPEPVDNGSLVKVESVRAGEYKKEGKVVHRWPDEVVEEAEAGNDEL